MKFFRNRSKAAPDPMADAGDLEQLRTLFRGLDKAGQRRMLPTLPPCDISFDGVTLHVDPRDNYTERRIWLTGRPPEKKSLKALSDLVRGKRAYVLDIGANCGAYSVPLAHKSGEDSRVIAFEPNPEMIGRLGRNVAMNALGHVVRIEGCALDREPGEAFLNFNGRNFGQASIAASGGLESKHGGTLVPVRTLHDYVPDPNAYDVTVLKIDVEGAEARVLAPLLTNSDLEWRPVAILLEVNHDDEWGLDIISDFQAQGYKITLEAEQNALLQR